MENSIWYYFLALLSKYLRMIYGSLSGMATEGRLAPVNYVVHIGGVTSMLTFAPEL